MGKLLKFPTRRKRYKPGKLPRPAKFRQRPKSWRQAWRETRFWVLLIFMATLIALYKLPGLVPLPTLLTTDAQQVSATFTRCDQGYTQYCVIDGDTIAIGSERIRIMGIDTPEKDGECEAETRLAGVATQELLEWLNAGPFWMRGRIDEPRDRYGRLLRELYRRDGAFNAYIGQHLIEKGVARRYLGGWREGWCG